MNELIEDVVFEAYPLVVVDCETTRNDPDGGPDPFYGPNRIVMTGWCQLLTGWCHLLIRDDVYTCTGSSDFIQWVNSLELPITLVGFNIKFDLHYLRREGLDMSKIASVIDLALLVHYDSGSELIFPSLDEAAAYKGLTIRKDDSIKKLWDDGVKTEDIDPELLRNYLIQDIKVTKELLAQLDIPPVLETIMSKATLALAEIEYNGMYYDRDELLRRIIGLAGETTALDCQLKDLAMAILPGTNPSINATSNTTVSTIVHGYPGVKVITKEPAGTYKNGKPKFKKKEFRALPTTKRLTPEPGTDMARPGPVDEATLLRLAPGLPPTASAYVGKLLEYRTKTKELETYYNPIFRAGIIRGEDLMRAQMHQVGTRTGRTSSSKPNGQNLPAKVREILVSRYEGGEIMAADFNQLEVCGVAQLSEDVVLIKHLTEGTDIHTEANGGERGTPEERRNVKGVVFGTFYGGGDKTLSEQTGLPLAKVKKIRDTLRLTYPDAIDYNKKVKEELSRNAVNTGEVIDGYAVKRGTYKLPTGRNLSFRTVMQKRKLWSRPGGPEVTTMEWPHSQCCDRPIQALSTGDLSQAYLALVHEFMRNYDSEGWFKDVKIVMFAHDEVVFDVPPTAPKDALVATLKVLAEKVLPELYKEWTGTDWLTPLRLNVNFSKHWSK